MKSRLRTVSGIALLGSGILAALTTMRAAGAGEIHSHTRSSAPAGATSAKIIRIETEPHALSLNGRRDERSLIVTGFTAAGYAVDLSATAKLIPASKIISIGTDGYIHPEKTGVTALTVAAAGKLISVPVTVRSVQSPPVSFVRDVMPTLSKSGCNAGTCHGSARGKNGFKLSLRGYDSDFDYQALIDDVDGRRFNRSDPAQSLMLLKPTGAVPHKGGVLFQVGSPAYRLLLQWISEGVRSDVAITKRVSQLEVMPTTPNVTLPGMVQRTMVIARYPDGSTRDVTRDAVFTSSLPEVALVSASGTVQAVRRGEASLLVRYEGTYGSNNITVLGDRSSYQWTPTPEFSYIDKLVDQKLLKVKALPAPLCDDATFMRRIYLDLTGLPPTPEQTRAFLSDNSDNRAKRTHLIDTLLVSREYEDKWTSKWADLLDVNSKYIGDPGVLKFRNWIHSAVADNMPYDKFVRSLMTASGDAYQNAPANYLRIARDTSTATENITQLFLGVRFSCAKCHDHPFERWTQNQYYQLGAFFARVGYKNTATAGDEVIFNRDEGEVMHPKTGLAVAPAVPVGKLSNANLVDRRTEFADWLVSPENPFFSRAMVNRLWSYFLGKGIIDPVDDIRASNPPSNPALLEALNTDFVHSKFDLKHMMRQIALSRVYQSSIAVNHWNEDDKINFSHAMPRRLEAEQLLDAIHIVTGTDPNFKGLPAGTRAGQIPDAAPAGGDGFLDLFGKPARQTPCECERSSTVSLGQALNLINGPTISDAIAAPHGRLSEFIKTNPTDQNLMNEVFLTALARYPTTRESTSALKVMKSAPTMLEGAQDLMWALINSPAFLFNR